MKAKLIFHCFKIKYCFKLSLLLLLFVASSSPCLCQPSSFQVELDNTDYQMEDIAINESGEIVALLSDGFAISSNLYLVPISGENTIEHGYKLDAKKTVTFSIESLFVNHNLIVSYGVEGSAHNDGRILSFNLDTGDYWAKKTRSDFYFGPSIKTDAEGHLVIANGVPNLYPPYFQNRILELHKLDTIGNTIWKKGIILNKNVNTANERGIYPYEMAIGSDGSLYIIGKFASNGPYAGSPNDLAFIIKTDQFGNPLKWKTFPHQIFKDLLLTDDGLYLLDKKSHLPNAEIYNPATILLKLDKDLNTIWAKEYAAENCWFFTANINKLPTGNLLLSTAAAYSSYPALIAEIDTDGNILNQKGYPHYNPTINIMNDGSFLIGSREHFDSTGQTTNQTIIGKADTDGNIGGCANYPACLNVGDISIEIGDMTIDTIWIADLQADTVNMLPFTFALSPYCGYPPPPIPDFEFRDTLCIGETAEAAHTYNLLAQAWAWHLVGHGVDTVIDSPNFEYRFTTAGDFLLRQTIWLLGCTYSFEKTITILPPLEASITPENICPDSLHELRVRSNRPLKNYFWANGATTSTVPISSPGTYAVAVTDAYCSATDTAYVTDVAQLLGNNPPFTLPLDVVGCQPFELVPQSLFGNQFLLATDTTPAPNFLLDKEGSYQIGMKIMGCEFWKTYHYSVDCQVDIYLPNAFSPNDDGINDVFAPLGDEFEVVSLSIYDRWGGLVFTGKEWDGGDLGQGTYTYQLRYLNLKSGMVEELDSEVTLLR